MIITEKGRKKLDSLRTKGKLTSEFLLLNAIDLEGNSYNIKTTEYRYQDYLDLFDKGYLVEEDEEAEAILDLSREIYKNPRS